LHVLDHDPGYVRGYAGDHIFGIGGACRQRRIKCNELGKCHWHPGCHWRAGCSRPLYGPARDQLRVGALRGTVGALGQGEQVRTHCEYQRYHILQLPRVRCGNREVERKQRPASANRAATLTESRQVMLVGEQTHSHLHVFNCQTGDLRHRGTHLPRRGAVAESERGRCDDAHARSRLVQSD
jgi:hypothetical protein